MTKVIGNYCLMQVRSPGSCSGCPWLPCFTGARTMLVLRPAGKHKQIHTVQYIPVRYVDIGITAQHITWHWYWHWHYCTLTLTSHDNTGQYITLTLTLAFALYTSNIIKWHWYWHWHWHCITASYIALNHYIDITLHYITLHYITLHFITLQWH